MGNPRIVFVLHISEILSAGHLAIINRSIKYHVLVLLPLMSGKNLLPDMFSFLFHLNKVLYTVKYFIYHRHFYNMILSLLCSL